MKDIRYRAASRAGLFWILGCAMALGAAVPAGIPIATAEETPEEASAGNRLFLKLGGRSGSVVPHADFLSGANASQEPIEGFQSLSLEFGVQTDGSEIWERAYKYPTYGIGFYGASFSNGAELGSPNALYGFFSAPIVRMSRSAFTYQLGLGLAFNWNGFDDEINRYNTAVSTPLTVYIDFGVDYLWQLTPRWGLEAGLTLTHFSNGGMRQPNDGLNLISPQIALQYNLSGDPVVFNRSPIPPHRDHWELFVSLARGTKGTRTEFWDGDEQVGAHEASHDIANLSTGLQRQIAYTHKVGGGLDITYDGSLGYEITVEDGAVVSSDAPTSDKISLGAYFSWEFVFHRASVVLQPGIYLMRQDFNGNRDWFYQKVGFKYHVGRHLFAGVSVRTLDFDFAADFIEWTLGTRF